jgi:hypothetical protein
VAPSSGSGETLEGWRIAAIVLACVLAAALLGVCLLGPTSVALWRARAATEAEQRRVRALQGVAEPAPMALESELRSAFPRYAAPATARQPLLLLPLNEY